MPRFVPRERKHKVINRQASSSNKKIIPSDSKVEILVSAKNSKRDELRRELRESVKAQQPRISSAKQKRLDKYIVYSSLACRYIYRAERI